MNDYLSAVSLAPREPSSQDSPLPPWVLIDSVANRSDGVANADDIMLEATLETYGDVLDTTCDS